MLLMGQKAKVFYDDPLFDYKKYWATREYENQSEKIALKRLFHLIPQTHKKTIIDIAGGFGRLTPVYAPLFKSCLLIEPSQKLLDEAKKLCQEYKNLIIKRGFLEKLPVGNQEFDVALFIRAIHHLSDLGTAMKEINRALKPGGFLILEFANKFHLKNCLKALFSLNFKFFTDHTAYEISQKRGSVPFINYHPNRIKTLLLSNGFRIIKSLSVSNFRFLLFKKFIPLAILLFLESSFSLLTSHFSLLRYCGPSIFILAQKEAK